MPPPRKVGTPPQLRYPEMSRPTATRLSSAVEAIFFSTAKIRSSIRNGICSFNGVPCGTDNAPESRWDVRTTKAMPAFAKCPGALNGGRVRAERTELPRRTCYEIVTQSVDGSY